jgi:hypothetical protein
MVSIDPETRDVVQTVYIRRVERVGGELRTSIRQDGGCDDCRDRTSTAFNRPTAQTEIEHLMKKGYSIDEAREVALPMFILLKPEPEKAFV